VNTVVARSGRPENSGLWEWADALGQPELVPRDTGFVLTIERLQRIVAEMARAVAILQGAIATAPRGVLADIERARASVRAAWEASLRDADHRRAAAEAAEAFRRRDFSQVVTVLEPLGQALTPAERKKLAYARQHLRAE
jgi:hypothetical protein